LASVASAQAADLPVKAAPVEYVKVCSLYGAGFFYIPGTDTCLKIGGYLRSDHMYGSGSQAGYYLTTAQGTNPTFTRTGTDEYSWRARVNLTVDFRTQSDYGTIRAYAAIIAQQSTADLGNTTGAAGILRAFIQFAGFTVGHAVSYYDFMNGADYGYVASIWAPSTGVNGTDLLAYTWQIGNGFSASIDIEDNTGGRGKTIFNLSNPGVLNGGGAAALGGFPNLVVPGLGSSDILRSDMPDLAANLRVDQAWGSAQIMGALANRSAGYYSNVPGLPGLGFVGPGNTAGFNPGNQVFGHPGEAWGYAVGVGAKFVNFLLPRDTIEGQASFCHGAVTGYCVSGLYAQNFIYGSGNTITMGYTADGVITNGSQVELTNAFNWALGYQHYWSPQWRTAVVGGQAFVWYNGTAAGMFCGGAVGSAGAFGANGLFVAFPGTFQNCNPNFSQSAVSTRTAWNPHPFLEIGLDLIYFHVASANAGSTVILNPNGARPGGFYTIGNFDGAMAVLRFQKNILP
jgi:hypothetical protein